MLHLHGSPIALSAGFGFLIGRIGHSLAKFCNPTLLMLLESLDFMLESCEADTVINALGTGTERSR